MSEDLENQNLDNQARQFPGVEIIEGTSEGSFFHISAGEIVLGRSKKVSNISLEDTSVSRRHVRFFRDGDAVFIQDLGSRNGTKVNGEKIDPSDEVELNHKDRIQIGLYILKYLTQELADDEDQDEDEIMIDEIDSDSIEKSPPPSPEDQEVENQDNADANEGDEEKKEPNQDLDQLDQVSNDDQTYLAPSTPKKKRKWPRYLFWLFLVLFLCSAFLYYYPILKKNNYKEYYSSMIDHVNISELLDRGVVYFEGLLEVFLGEENHVTTSHSDQLVHHDSNEIDQKQKSNINDQGQDKAEKSKKKKDDFINSVLNEIVGEKTLDNDNQNSSPAPIVITEFDAEDPNLNRQVREVPVFLDVVSDPISAQIFFDKKELGTTPLKSELNLIPGNSYEVKAIFHLDQINQVLEKKINFVANAKESVANIEFSLKLATITIAKLPRFADVYLEGQFVHDSSRTYPIKINDIVYGRPIYVPYGNYQLELREKKSIEGSSSLISSVKYIRKFILNDEQDKYRVEANDKDLNHFPISIITRPDGAEVYVDQEKVGRTPYQGKLKQGQHVLEIKKNGYFDEKRDINIQINTPFNLDLHLKTSEAGGLLNRGKGYFTQNRLPLAFETLTRAIKANPNHEEEGEIYLYLGKVSLARNTYESALGYFNKATLFDDFKYEATLGLAEVYHKQGNIHTSLRKLIEVFLNVTPQHHSYEKALDVFKKISDLKSVVYVNSIPDGASVIVNDKELTQKTPVILSGLDPRKLSIEISKAGYKTKFIQHEVPFNVFLPIVVELKK